MQVKTKRILLVATGTLLVIAAIAMYYTISSATRNDEQRTTSVYTDYSMPLPPDVLAGYKLARLVTGEAARNIISRIHWEPVEVENAAIAVYGNRSKGFIVWVARVKGACRLVERMASKMAEYEHQLPYTAPQRVTHGGITFYISVDKRNGSRHIFWCEGEYVIWLQAAGVTSDQLLDAIVKLVNLYWPDQHSK